jgi:hypothetical protein
MVLSPQLRRTAVVHTAETILRDAGVDAEWLECAAPARDVADLCRAPRRADDLVVRIIHDGDIPAADGRFALGYAVVDADRRLGTLATVFAERVVAVASQARTDPDVLLGRAVAHEVGHLLLRSQAHSDSGLMRDIWTDAELFRNRPQDWVFTVAERASLGDATAPIAAATVPDTATR